MRPVAVDGRARAHRVLARMARGEQVLGAVLAPAHRLLAARAPAPRRSAPRGRARSSGRSRRRCRAQITVTCDSLEAQPARELGAVGMRHLVADMHGQVLAALVPHGAAAARLDRRVGLAMLMERGLDDDRRLGEAPRRIAGREGLMRDQVATAASRRPARRRAPARLSCRGDRRRAARSRPRPARRRPRRDSGRRATMQATGSPMKRTLSIGSVVISTGCRPCDRRRHAQRRGPLARARGR